MKSFRWINICSILLLLSFGLEAAEGMYLSEGIETNESLEIEESQKGQDEKEDKSLELDFLATKKCSLNSFFGKVLLIRSTEHLERSYTRNLIALYHSFLFYH